MKDTTIEVNGMTINTKGGIYEITPRFDADAPDGYKNKGTTKILSSKTGRNSHSATFHPLVKVWDTGLFKESPMYANYTEDEKDNLMEKVQELIVEPFEKMYGEGKLDHKDENSPFWNYQDKSSFNVDTYNGRIFNTDNVRHRLELFIMLSTKTLVPKDKEDDASFDTAQFCIENRDEVKSQKESDSLMEVEVMGAFYDILTKTSKRDLILNYIGISIPTKAKKEVVATVFKTYIENKQHSHQNKKIFLETYKKSNTKDGLQELGYYREIQSLYKKGKIIKEGEYLFIGEEKLGNSLKEAAKTAVKNKNIAGLLMQEKE